MDVYERPHRSDGGEQPQTKASKDHQQEEIGIENLIVR